MKQRIHQCAAVFLAACLLSDPVSAAVLSGRLAAGGPVQGRPSTSFSLFNEQAIVARYVAARSPGPENALKSPSLYSRLLSFIRRDSVQTSSRGFRKNGIFAPIYYLRDADDWGCGDLRSLLRFILFASLENIDRVQVPPITLSDYRPAPYAVLSTILKEPTYINPEWMVDDVAALLPREAADRLRQSFLAYRQAHQKDIERARQNTAQLTDAAGTPQTYHLMDTVQVTQLKNGVFDLLWEAVKDLDEQSALKRSMAEFEARPDNQDEELKSLRHHLLYVVLKEENMQQDSRRGWDSRTWGHLSEANEGDLTQAMAQRREALARELFIQWAFDRQFTRVLDFAEAVGVTLADDRAYAVPKADAWLRPDVIYHGLEAGVPADEFSPVGQRWQGRILNWRHNFAAVERYWQAQILHGLGREPDPRADLTGYEQEKVKTRAKLKTWISGRVKADGQVSDRVVTRVGADLQKIRRRHRITGRQGVMMRRRDHAYGDVRSYAYTTTKVALGPLLENEIAGRDADSETHRGLARDASNKLLDRIRSAPEFAAYLDSIFDLQGNLRTSVMIQLGRPARGQQPPLGRWQRIRGVVEKAVTTDGPTDWDYAAVTDVDEIWREKLGEQPLDRMMNYLWPKDPADAPRPEDEIMIGFYEYNDGRHNNVEGPLQRVFDSVVRRGAILVVELLGNPYVPAQQMVGRIVAWTGARWVQLLQIIPVIWGMRLGDDYHHSRHNSGSQVTAALQDSHTLIESLIRERRDRGLPELDPALPPLPPGLFEGDALKAYAARFLLQWVYRSPAPETMVALFDLLMSRNHEGRPNDPEENSHHPNWVIRLTPERTVMEMIRASLGQPTLPWARDLVNLIRYLLDASSGVPNPPAQAALGHSA